MTIGFIGGYLGGLIDDILSMLTNIVLVIPTLAVLIIVAAYLSVSQPDVGGDPDRAHLLAVGRPRDPRPDVLLAGRDFVNLARLSGRGTIRVIVNEIAPNMSSYLFLTFILLFGGSVLTAATLDFLGLGPSRVMSLGLMMNTAVSNAHSSSACGGGSSHPGRDHRDRRRPLRDERRADEVFNPRLRRT